jgi:hypothetical protein
MLYEIAAVIGVPSTGLHVAVSSPLIVPTPAVDAVTVKVVVRGVAAMINEPL